MFLSIVIPAYNETDNIESVLEELQNMIKTLSMVNEFEIIVVDDHSSDNTFSLISRLSGIKNNIKGIRLSRRSGSHTALRAGIAHAKGDAVLCISADGQDNPDVLKEMIDKIQAGSQIVWALRQSRDESFFLKLFAFFFYKLLRWMIGNENDHINLSNTDFFLLNKKIVNAVNQCPERNTSLFGLLIWLGFQQDYVNYERRNRRAGNSKWNFRSRMRLAKDWVIAFSGMPLKLMSVIGLIIAVIGFLYALFIIIYSLLGYIKPGWAETVILILIIGGIQMTMLGIIGEYLWRNLDETRKRPLYFIEKDSDEN